VQALGGPDPGQLDAYAELVIGAGVSLQPGQKLLVNAEHDHAPLARALAARAYEAGAAYVDVLYSDPLVRRALVATGPEGAIGSTPTWMLERLERALAEDAAVVSIIGAAHAAIFDGLDPERLARARYLDLDRRWIQAVVGRELPWAIVAYPTEEWAREAFGEPDVGRLWEALARVLRLDADDPTAAWQARADELGARARELTERGFDALHYRGPGTELEVGLIGGARWLAGRDTTAAGQPHIANLPTEEVFTSPDRNRAEGRVRSTKPLALGGGLVEGLEVELSGGEITEVRADRGADLVRTELALDDGARRLGEVALVDTSSRVAETRIVFQNTLFDENAASHIAWGAGLGWVIDHLPEGAPAAALLNESRVHTDFMVGGPEVEIDAVERDGTVVPLLYGGEWRI
jgi:aminopeptidase